MTMWEMIAERARQLPVEKQREVLDFVEFLRAHEAPRRPLRDLAGLFKGFDISPEDIDEARREMWRAFPRDDV
jgi:erythromycin esterase-like protein